MASLSRNFRSDYAQAGLFNETVHRLLNEKECSIFNRGLADYHKRRNVKLLVECLSLVLTTPHKRRLLIPIRDTYVEPSDVSKFNQLVQAYGIATSHRKKQKADEMSTSSAGRDGLRKVEVRRDTDGEWGFSIRGGAEHGLGIFVSWIEPRSNAEKSGLQVGDQILNANDMSFEMISHFNAMMVIQGAKRLQLHALAHGQVPGSRMAHKVYHWVDPEGRPCSPPPDPFEIQDRARGADHKWIATDERKVTVMVDKGKDLGISIRGGIEHGLGIYISAVEEYSVAESYGLKIGDQILEVNGICFLGIVHSDAANALCTQPCMIVKVKDVRKLPHSRITTYNQNRYSSSPLAHDGINVPSQPPAPPPPIFRTGVGSQIMLGQQQDSLLRGHGLLKDVAQSVLSQQEFAMFMHYINQYQRHNLSVNKLLPPILNLLDTPEKLQLITELRGLMKPQDIEHFNELTVHREIMAKKYVKSVSTPHSTWPSIENSGRDTVPQKLSPERPNKMKHFIVPPPSTSTPVGQLMGLQKTMSGEDIWNGGLDCSELSSIHPNEKVDNSLIEVRIRNETESRLQNDFEEKKKTMVEEHQRLLEEERAQNEKMLHREREEMEKKMMQREEFLKAEIEESIRLESAREINSQLAEKEQSLQEEKERLLQEEQQKEEQFQQRQQQLRQQLEEKIWKEADEHLREEYEQKRQQEREASLQRRNKVSEKAVTWDVEGRIRRNLESRIKKEYEEKLAKELSKLKKEEEKELTKREEEAEWKKQEEIARLEAEEQSRIELEEKIRRETELKVKAEYEVHLNNESKERAKLAKELKARKSAEERLEKEKMELQREGERQQKKFEKEQREKEMAMSDIAKEKEELERMIKQQPHSQQREATSDEEEEATSEPNDLTPDQTQEQQMLEQQRHFRLNKDREEEERHQQEIANLENERTQEQTHQAKRKELERKREENLRKKEEERKKKELERKLLIDKNKQPSPCLRRDSHLVMEKEKKRQETERKAAVAMISQVKVNFGEEDSSLKIKKTKHKTIEEERLKAEQKLERRLKRSQAKEKKNSESKSLDEVPVEMNTIKSFGGFTNLQGKILHINVTKVVKKLGIAIDGGANTKQKAVIIREMSPEGCATLTGMGMDVNQQLLQINGRSFFGLKHREVVMEIKKAFEGPMNKVLEFVVLDSTSD